MWNILLQRKSFNNMKRNYDENHASSSSAPHSLSPFETFCSTRASVANAMQANGVAGHTGYNSEHFLLLFD